MPRRAEGPVELALGGDWVLRVIWVLGFEGWVLPLFGFFV